MILSMRITIDNLKSTKELYYKLGSRQYGVLAFDKPKHDMHPWPDPVKTLGTTP